MSRVRFSAVTHVGCVRTLNEDSIVALADQNIWVVADGMGGHAAGDYASQAVTDSIAAIPPDLEPTERLRALRTALQAAHAEVRAEAERRGGVTVGAAVVAMILTDGHFAAFWAGDCRLYLFRDGGIEMLTTDHSLVATLVTAGRLTWDEAEAHPQSNAITRAVGVGDTLELDKIRGEVMPGDRFLLCSDGLNKYAGFETLRQALDGSPIETVAHKLLQLALDGGGADNISVIVVDIE